MSGAVVDYFAFGANTCTHVLRRRGIVPLESEAAELPDHRLAFVQRGVPIVEPAFASVLPEPGGCVHGVVHRLRADDLARLDRAESPGYARHERLVIARARGPLRAQLYVSQRPRFGLRPSRRYRDLLVRGAREFELPEAWVAELLRVECAEVPLVSRAVPWIVALLDAATRRGGP